MVKANAEDFGSGSGLTEFVQNEQRRWREARLIMKASDLEFTTGRGGTVAQVVNGKLGFPNRQLGSFIREVPPASKSGKHRHNMEAVLHIINGRGYTQIEDDKYEWTAGDTITIPPMAVHQHFNTDSDETVRIFAVTTVPLMMNIGALQFHQIEWVE